MSHHKIRGFTLVEIMVAVTILGMLMAGVLFYFIQQLKLSYANEYKNVINKEVRHLVSTVSLDTKSSNYFLLYTDFDQRVPQKNQGTGDFIVLVTLGEPQISGGVYGNRPVTNIIGYYRVITDPAKNLGDIRRFEKNLNNVTPASLISNLPTRSEINDAPIVFRNVEGLANDQVFYNFREKSLILKMQFKRGGDMTSVKHHLSFTVSPRS